MAERAYAVDEHLRRILRSSKLELVSIVKRFYAVDDCSR